MRHITAGMAGFSLSTLLTLAVVTCATPPCAADETKAADPVPSESAKKHFDQAEVLREEGKWKEAAKEYGASLDADESQYLAHLRYQEAVIEDGDASSLPPEYEETLKKSPNDVASKLHRLRLDGPQVRMDGLLALLKANPGDPMVLLEIGRANLANGDVPGAKKALETVFSQKPDLADALWLSCEALRRSGDVGGARVRLEAVVKARPDTYEAALRLARLDIADGHVEDALKRAESVLTMRPSYVAALLLKSEAASRLGKNEDARSALDAALRIHPTDVEALVASADLMAKGATEEGLKRAVEAYKKVLALKNAPQLRAFYGLGWAQERLNLLKEAADAYREASLLAPADAGVVNSIGVVLLKLKNFQGSQIQFKKAIDLDPKSPEAYCNMASVAEHQSDWNEAIKWYQKVLSIKGQEKNVRALLNCAFDQEALSQYKRAEELLRKVREIRPEDSEVATYLADNLFFQKRYKESIRVYQEAVKLDDKNRFAWRGLGIGLAQDDKPQDAVDALEKAKALKKDDQPTLLVLGDLYMTEIKNLEKALENYEAYVKAGGNNPDVPVIIDELKKEIESKKSK